MNYKKKSLSDAYKIILKKLSVLLNILCHAFQKLLIVKFTNNCRKIMFSDVI